MASTYSSSLNLELQATGENSGSWGTKTNNNLQKLESAIKGYVSIAITGTTQSLSVSSGGTTDEQSNVAIKLTGTLAGNTVLSCEAVETWYIIDNATTMSTHSLTFKPSGGTGVDLVAGSKHIIYTDEQMNDYMNSNADKEILDLYWKMNHIVAKADIWRYTILLERGGIYLDIDSKINRSLNDLIESVI